jgi:hypothetical protein
MIHARDANGWQAIHEATRGGHLEVLLFSLLWFYIYTYIYIYTYPYMRPLGGASRGIATYLCILMVLHSSFLRLFLLNFFEHLLFFFITI